MISFSTIIGVARATAVAGAVLVVARASQPTPGDMTTLTVSGRASANVSIAAREDTVVVAWSAAADTGADIYIAVSTDGAATFSQPRRVNDIAGDTNPSGEQPPRIALGADAVHVIWPARRGRNAVAYARSTDGGRRFSKAVDVPASGLAGARGWASLAVDPQGTVHMVWLDGRAATPADAGHAMHGGHDPQQDVYHASWRIGGAIEQTRIAENVCFCCKTAVAISRRDVFAAWRHIYPGSIRDIAFARSVDGGATFRAPVRVSPDGWELDGCPDDGPALVVDGRDRVRVAWPTLIAGPTPRKAIFYATSRDGRRFTQRTRLDAGTADPAHPQIALARDGTAAVVWDEMSDGTRRIMLRRVTPDDTLAPAEVVTTERGATYPSIAATTRGFVVAWTSGASDARVIKVQRISQSR